MPDNEKENEKEITQEKNNAMAETELKRTEYVIVEEMPAPDDLLVGMNSQGAGIKIFGAGDFKRGLLLMAGANGEFSPATKSEIANANEICILADNISLNEGEYTQAAAYFTGAFRAKGVILGWEDENSNHSEELDAIESTLRKHSIFIFE